MRKKEAAITTALFEHTKKLFTSSSCNIFD